MSDIIIGGGGDKGDLVDIGQPNMDYRNFGIPNILPTAGDAASQKDDPFEGEVPDDAQGYRQYKDHYEKKMQEVMTDAKTGMQTGFMKHGINCEDKASNGQPLRMNRKKPEHEGCGIVCACNHVIHNDPVNPANVYFVPFSRGSSGGYYLCNSCHRSLERKKLDIGVQVSMKCAQCVLEAIMLVNEKHPDRLINLNAL